jgi:hypothetical protein
LMKGLNREIDLAEQRIGQSHNSTMATSERTREPGTTVLSHRYAVPMQCEHVRGHGNVFRHYYRSLAKSAGKDFCGGAVCTLPIIPLRSELCSPFPIRVLALLFAFQLFSLFRVHRQCRMLCMCGGRTLNMTFAGLRSPWQIRFRCTWFIPATMSVSTRMIGPQRRDMFSMVKYPLATASRKLPPLQNSCTPPIHLNNSTGAPSTSVKK